MCFSHTGSGGAASGLVHLPVRRTMPFGTGHLLPGAHGDVRVVPGQVRAGPRASHQGRAAVHRRRYRAGSRHVHGARRHRTLVHAAARHAAACLDLHHINSFSPTVRSQAIDHLCLSQSFPVAVVVLPLADRLRRSTHPLIL